MCVNHCKYMWMCVDVDRKQTVPVERSLNSMLVYFDQSRLEYVHLPVISWSSNNL